MCFTFKKNNKWTKKPVNCFLQDGASAGIRSLQTYIVIKLCQTPGDGLQILFDTEFIRIGLGGGDTHEIGPTGMCHQSRYT